MEKRELSPGKGVVRTGETVRRPVRPWSGSVCRFQRFMEADGLPVEAVMEMTGSAVVTAFCEGETNHPRGWSDEALYEVGRLLARFHRRAASFEAGPGDVWQPWCLREIGGGERLCCHGDFAPWNLLTRGGLPLLVVDWEYAGPLDPMVELSRVCWLFPQLVDDDVARRWALPDAKKRAEQVRIVCDGYGLVAAQRRRLPEQIVETVICETAHEAIDPGVSTGDAGPLWGFAWRTRSLYWIWRHRALLRRALD